MSHLTPEVRVNKNGVPVTKHVNPGGKASSATTVIPAPAPPTATADTPLVLTFSKPANSTQVRNLFDPINRRTVKEPLKRMNSTGLGILKRLMHAVPDHEHRIAGFISNTGSLLPSEDEMTNAMLIPENVLTTNRSDLDALLHEDTFASFGIAVIGLRNLELYDQGEIAVISTQEQLDADTAAATFIGKYGRQLDYDSEDHPLLGYMSIDRGTNWAAYLPSIRNPHLDALIRERPEEHETIFEYLSERGLSATDTGPVDHIRAYVDENKHVRSLRDGWL
jgi:hypothetical protein